MNCCVALVLVRGMEVKYAPRSVNILATERITRGFLRRRSRYIYTYAAEGGLGPTVHQARLSS